MPDIEFVRLALKGFGRYKDGVTAEFSPGVNLFLAQNESGKSTLAAGLAAVIFGLASNAEKDRYRNWDGSVHFEGEVLFRCNGVLHHILRDFETQSIRVRVQTDEGKWSEVLRGTHNPRANKPNVQYLEYLQGAFGFASAEIFRQTFFLEQPLPAGNALSRELQQMLSGGGHFQAVSERLKQALKAVTRFGNRHYTGVSQGHKNQRLENVSAERQQLEAELASAVGQADELQRVMRELAQLEDEHRRADGQAQSAARIKSAFDQWTVLRERCDNARTRKNQLDKALAHVEKLDMEIRELTLEEAGGQAFAVEEKAVQDAEELLAQYGDLKQLGDQPLETLEATRRWHEEKAAILKRLAYSRNEYHIKSASLVERFALLAQAGEERLLSLGNYSVNRQHLASSLADAKREYELALDRERQIQSLRHDIKVTIGDPEELSIETAADLEVAASLKENVMAESAVRGQRAGRSKPVWPLVAGLLAAAGLYVLWGREAQAVGLIVCLGLVVLGGVASAMLGRDTSTSKAGLSEDAAAWEALSHRQPSLAALPLSQLAAVSLKLKQYRELRMVSPEAELEQKRKSVEYWQQEQDTWQGQMAPYEERFGNPQEALAAWRAERDHLEKLSERIDQLAAVLGTESSADKLPGVNRRILHCLSLLGIKHELGEEIYSALDALAPSRWDQLEERIKDSMQAQQAARAAAGSYSNKKQELEQILRTKSVALNEALRANGAASLDELRARHSEAMDSHYLSHREWKEYIQQHPGLPDMEAARDTALVFAHHEEIKRAAAHAEQVLREYENRMRELGFLLSRLEGRQLINAASAEEHLAALREEEKALQVEARAIGLAATELDQAVMEFQETYREKLSAAITEHFARITGSDRHVSIDQGFTLTVSENHGQPVEIEQLSQGAKDQLYLALRLGLADLISDTTQIPLILDDPFLTSDNERLERIGSALQNMGRQVLLLSHSSRFAEWGNTLEVK
jgi:DNA repair exonuclease SbcCD ATPase subunit